MIAKTGAAHLKKIELAAPDIVVGARNHRGSCSQTERLPGRTWRWSSIKASCSAIHHAWNRSDAETLAFATGSPRHSFRASLASRSEQIVAASRRKATASTVRFCRAVPMPSWDETSHGPNTARRRARHQRSSPRGSETSSQSRSQSSSRRRECTASAKYASKPRTLRDAGSACCRPSLRTSR